MAGPGGMALPGIFSEVPPIRTVPFLFGLLPLKTDVLISLISTLRWGSSHDVTADRSEATDRTGGVNFGTGVTGEVKEPFGVFDDCFTVIIILLSLLLLLFLIELSVVFFAKFSSIFKLSICCTFLNFDPVAGLALLHLVTSRFLNIILGLPDATTLLPRYGVVLVVQCVGGVEIV